MGMITLRRILRRSGLAAGGIALLLGLLFGLLQTGPAKERLKDYLLAALGEEAGMTIGAERLEGLLPFHFRLIGLRVFDDAGAWLSAERLEASIAPLEALGSRYRLIDAQAHGVALERLPEESSTPEDAFTLPAWPDEIALDGFRLADVSLDAAIAGAPVRLTAEGRILPDWGEGAMAGLRVLATEGSDGFLDLHFAAPRGGGAPMLTLTLHEPQGGLLARLLDLPGAPALAFDATGESDDSRWSGTVRGGFAGLAEIDATLALEGGERLGLAAAGRADIGGLLEPGAAEALLAGGLEFDLAAALTPEGHLEIARAAVALAAGTLEASGRIGAGEAALELGLEIPVLAALGPASGGDLAGRLSARGTLAATADEAVLDLALALAEPAIAGLGARSFAADIRLARAATAWHYRLDGAFEHPRGLPDAVSGLIGAKLAVTFEGDAPEALTPVSIRRFALDGLKASLAAAGTLANAGTRFDGTVELALPDLAAALPAAGIGGRAALRGPVTLDLARASGETRFEGTLETFSSGIEALDRLAGTRLAVSGEGARGEDGEITLSSLAIAGETARLEARGAIDGAFSGFEASATLMLSELAALSEALGIGVSGGANIEAAFAGEIGHPRGRIVLTGIGLDIADAGIDSLTATLETAGPLERLEGVLSARALRNGAAFELASETALGGEELCLAEMQLTAPGGRAQGEVCVALASGLARGTLDGTFDDLVALGAALDQPLGGAGKFGLALASREGAQHATLNLRAAPLAFAAQRLERFDLEAEGDLENVVFALSAEDDGPPGRALALAGRAALAGPARLEIARFEGRYGTLALRQRTPFAVALGANRLSLEGLDLAWGEGTLAGGASIGPETLEGRLRLDAVPLASLKVLAPELPLEQGLLSGTVELAGSRASPQGRLALRAEELRFLADSALPAVTLAADGSWNEGRLALEAALSDLPENTLAVNAELPLVLAPDTLAIAIPGEGALEGRLSGSGEIAPLARHLIDNGDTLAGRYAVDLTLAGTWSTPRFAGSGTFSRGAYENFASGALLTEIEADIAAAGERIMIERIAARDGGEGTLHASGSASIEAQSFVLDATFRNATLVRRDEATIEASGTVRFAAAPEGSALSGTATIETAEILIPDRFSSAPEAIPVIEINRPPGLPPLPTAEKAAPAAASGGIALDLTIDMPRRVFIRGKGLESEWAGALTLRGSADKPRIEGTIAPVRGTLSLIGKTFTLGEGSIRFAGQSPPDPEFDVVAQTTTADMVAGVRVRGLLSAPAITLESEPALPSDEILARLLFGKSTGEISAIQAAQLANAAATLTGSGPDLLGDVRQSLGVDTLTFSGEESAGPAGAAVSVGKYLSDEVFISVERGLTQESGRVNVEIEVLPAITLESTLGADSQGNAWLNWKYAY